VAFDQLLEFGRLDLHLAHCHLGEQDGDKFPAKNGEKSQVKFFRPNYENLLNSLYFP
jgi:hypothetical protein